MFDFSVFKVRRFSGAIMGSIGMNFSFWPFIIFLPIYYQGALGYDLVAAGLSLLAYTLPTLVMPPIAERLSQRFQPSVIIPVGMLTIGLGFILMWLGIDFSKEIHWALLPGSLIAGIGLGLTNTPTTNTTTGSVPPNRAGMASGMDISARLITLAINIAVMGFVLLSGVTSYLKGALPNAVDATQIRLLAERIATGNLVNLNQDFPLLNDLASSAQLVGGSLSHGFEWVLLYGGLGAWALALISFAIFGSKSAKQ